MDLSCSKPEAEEREARERAKQYPVRLDANGDPR